MAAIEIDPGTELGDMIAFYETFFAGTLRLDMAAMTADLSKVIPLYPKGHHMKALVANIRFRGYTVTGATE